MHLDGTIAIELCDAAMVGVGRTGVGAGWKSRLRPAVMGDGFASEGELESSGGPTGAAAARLRNEGLDEGLGKFGYLTQVD